jgi:hypothetical protein
MRVVIETDNDRCVVVHSYEGLDSGSLSVVIPSQQALLIMREPVWRAVGPSWEEGKVEGYWLSLPEGVDEARYQVEGGPMLLGLVLRRLLLSGEGELRINGPRIAWALRLPSVPIGPGEVLPLRPRFDREEVI